MQFCKTHIQKSINYFTCTQHYYRSIGPQMVRGGGVVLQNGCHQHSGDICQPNFPSPKKNKRVGNAQKLWNIRAALHQNTVFENPVGSRVGFKREEVWKNLYPLSNSCIPVTKPCPKHPLWRRYGHLMRYLSLTVTLTTICAAFSAKIKWLTEEYAKNIFLRHVFYPSLYPSPSIKHRSKYSCLINIADFMHCCWFHALMRTLLWKKNKTNKTKQCSSHANWGRCEFGIAK